MIRGQLRPTLRLAIPVVLAELGWMAMGVVDTIMVGPLGPAAIATAGVGNALYLGFAIFGMGLLLGLDTLVSQAHGAGDPELCRLWLRRGIQLSLTVTVPLMLVLAGVWLAIPSFGFHDDTLERLRSFFQVLILGTPFLLGYATFRRYLQGIHRVTPVMVTLVTANIVNAITCYALVYGRLGMPALGVQGAAWATVTSRVYMCLLLAGVVWWSIRSERHAAAVATPVPATEAGHAAVRATDTPAGRRLATTSVRRLLALGLPAASTVTAEVGVFAATTALAGRLDPVATASHQIALNLAAVTFMVPLGLASAGAVRVGHAVGARNPHGAAAAGWTVIALGVAFMVCSGLSFLLMPHTLIGLFTREPAVLTLGTTLLFIAAVFQLFDGLQGVVTGTLRGLGDTRTPMVTNLAAHWAIGLPIGYTLCFVVGWGAPGLWCGLSAGLIIASIVLTTVWARRVRAYQVKGHL